MAVARVRISANFERNLEAMQVFLEQQQTSQTFNFLLDLLFVRLIPNLESHPRIGRDFLAREPGSVEGRMQHQRVTKHLVGGELREYILGDYLVLYVLVGLDITLLAIKHHHQLSFDLRKFWT